MSATDTDIHPPASRSQGRARLVGVAAVAALAAGTALILLLGFIPPTDKISPVSRTISEYGLSPNKWIFNTAVLLVAGGSAALFAAHLARRALPAVPALAGVLWTVSLLVIVAFPKTNWATGPSSDGVVHRTASIIGFVCLPVGILVASGRLFNGAPGWGRVARWLAIISLLWFGVILGAIVAALIIGGRWWLLIPLGLVERLMALTEILAVATLVVPLSPRKPQLNDLPHTAR